MAKPSCIPVRSEIRPRDPSTNSPANKLKTIIAWYHLGFKVWDDAILKFKNNLEENFTKIIPINRYNNK